MKVILNDDIHKVLINIVEVAHTPRNFKFKLVAVQTMYGSQFRSGKKEKCKNLDMFESSLWGIMWPHFMSEKML